MVQVAWSCGVIDRGGVMEFLMRNGMGSEDAFVMGEVQVKDALQV